MQQKEPNFIQSRFNLGERYVSKYSYKVDGCCQETNTIYEFDGCLWHGCDVCNTNQNPDGSLKETQPIRKISFAAIRKMTKEKKQAITAEGFRVVFIRECDLLKTKKATRNYFLFKNVEMCTTKTPTFI